MAYHIFSKNTQNMAFQSEIDGHTLILDTTAENSGDDSGASPKKVLLATLAACTGMDVVALLKKMRVNFSDFDIETKADLTEEHPKVFSHVSITYHIKVAEEDKAKVEKAVTLSQEKYCGISAMLKKNSPIDFHINYL
ncbi:MAG: OsmC family protein [Bacteroidia bacterium]